MTEPWLARLRTWLAEPRDAAGLAAFRVAIGLIVCISPIRFLAYGWVDELFAKPSFFFKYTGFEWVEPLAPAAMRALFVAIAVLGAMYAAGAFFRIVAPLLFVAFAYIQLIDITNWLNHYYLVSLLLLLSSLMPLGQAYGIDAWLFPKSRRTTLPNWCTQLFRFQVGVVYFYAGMAKLTGDWLVHAQPLDIWLHARSGLPFVGQIFDERAVAYFFSWGGFLYDTTVPFFLLAKRTRPYAYAVLIGFHAMVGWLFPIGMFPYIMALGALVFFAPDWPRRVLRVFAKRLGGWGEKLARAFATLERTPLAAPGARVRPLRTWVTLLGLAYAAVQVIVPLRSHLYGGNVLWHEQGMRFSWRVMAREKNGGITYLVDSPSRGRTWYVSPERYLTPRQSRELDGQPDLILQLAHHIKKDFSDRGVGDARVRVDARVSLNGRAATQMIDPNVDLAREADGFGPKAWITAAPDGPPLHLKSWSASHLASR